MWLYKLAVGVAASAGAAGAAYDAAIAYYTAAEVAPRALRAQPAIFMREQNWALLRQHGAGPESVQQIEHAAVRALLASPLEARALRQLALARKAAGAEWAAPLALAERVSLRDTGTQLALLQEATTAGRYDASLDHLDVLLTVLPDTGAQIFPVMATLVSDPQFRRALMRRSSRPWFRPFLAEAMASGDAAEVARLITESQATFSGDEPLAPLLQRLVERGRIDLARRLAISAGKAQPAALDSLALNPETTAAALAPLTWRLFSGDAVRWDIGGSGEAEVEVEPGRIAVLAERYTNFRPGNYVLTQRFSAEGTASGQWQMSCGAKQGEVFPSWREQFDLSSAGTARWSIPVPKGCGAQRWQLSATAAEGSAPARLRIYQLGLESR